jgi:hypothetical protein
MNREFDIFDVEAIEAWKNLNCEIKNPKGKVIKPFETSKQTNPKEQISFSQWLSINKFSLKKQLDEGECKEKQREIWEQTYCSYLSDVFKLPTS